MYIFLLTNVCKCIGNNRRWHATNKMEQKIQKSDDESVVFFFLNFLSRIIPKTETTCFLGFNEKDGSPPTIFEGYFWFLTYHRLSFLYIQVATRSKLLKVKQNKTKKLFDNVFDSSSFSRYFSTYAAWRVWFVFFSCF